MAQPKVSSAGRAAVMAGLTMALVGFAPVAAPLTALAETGSVTVETAQEQGTSYDAYQLFKADISEADEATHVAWASDGVKSATLEYLDGAGYGDWLDRMGYEEGHHDLPQVAGEYVAHMVGASIANASEATKPTTKEGRTFSYGLARALAASGVAATRVSANQAYDLDEGFWLFVTASESLEGEGRYGTAPLWVPVGGTAKNLVEKASVPSVDKQVKEDSTGAWDKVADAQRGQSISYRISGTLPQGLDAYETYHYRFEDTLGAGLTLAGGDTSTVKVKIDDQEIGEGLYQASYEKNVLTVDFENLLDPYFERFSITPESVITVEYDACLNAAAAVGSLGNPNDVVLVYTSDPVSGADGVTARKEARAFCYALQITKCDESGKVRLPGAKFTMQVSQNNTDDGSAGKYVQADGSLSEKAYEFVTDGNGEFRVDGLDEGAYVLRETAAPKGYVASDKEITVDIESKLDAENLSLTNLRSRAFGVNVTVEKIDAASGLTSASVTNPKAEKEKTTKDKDKSKDKDKTPSGSQGGSTTGGGSTTSPAGGIVSRIMPQTGNGPVSWILTATGLVLIVQGTWKLLRRRQEQD